VKLKLNQRNKSPKLGFLGCDSAIFGLNKYDFPGRMNRIRETTKAQPVKWSSPKAAVEEPCAKKQRRSVKKRGHVFPSFDLTPNFIGTTIPRIPVPKNANRLVEGMSKLFLRLGIRGERNR
jgi:hypothetical protein